MISTSISPADTVCIESNRTCILWHKNKNKDKRQIERERERKGKEATEGHLYH